MWKAGDFVTLGRSSMGADWDEPGIIVEIDEEDGYAYVENKEGDSFDIPLSDLRPLD